ncbi:ArsR/SmtB family transcription factor [Thalassotalea mangrovi]|uniref:Winged helix-turn-helix transcriptional regulator n=1 Tax=Thalassotalea mangrovi TaxID=2572245 RepID=A0A4U1B3G0_9GAMM|nr:metalloregulator ArsR/SmtB family transcription factor [Thalassotalea mangrovi]TKB44427.1 winged helix-turn-helix transcriptional regulator [Thalassotalea mangrovi]
MEINNIADNARQAANLLKLIGNEVRLMILCSLIENKLTVGQINERIDISQSALSQHLAKLRSDNLVECEKDGLSVYYHIANPVVIKIIHILQDEFCPSET